MAELPSGWFVEEGIGEHRAARFARGRLVEACVRWPGRVAAGWVVSAKLIARAAGSARGTAITPGGEEVLIDRIEREVSLGRDLTVLITRAAIDGPGRLKRAQGRHLPNASLQAPSLAASLGADGSAVSIVRRFPAGGWEELISDALHGQIAFPGGTLLLAATPAAVTVDVDGDLPPRALALAAVGPLAAALRRLDIGGSVVVDFPTLTDKGDRRAVDAALEDALAGWPHERTAMNGFGLVQIVARLERPSLLQLATWRRGGMVWRALLRRAQALEGPGTIELAINPALAAEAHPDHLAELQRRTGKRVALREERALALEAPNAQLIGDG